MSFNIPLIDNWGIRSDGKYNVILYQSDGNRDIDTFFYSSVPSAVEAFVNKKILQFDSTSVFGLIQAIKSLQTGLNKALLPLKLVCVPISELPSKKSNTQTKLPGEVGK